MRNLLRSILGMGPAAGAKSDPPAPPTTPTDVTLVVPGMY